MQPPIRVVVADPHRLFAEALASELARQPGMEVTGTALTAAELVRRVSETRPLVALSETMFEDTSALDVAPRLLRRHPDLKILFFLPPGVPEIILSGAAPLAAGLLLKSEPVAAVIEAIRRAAAGEMPVSADLAPRLRIDARRKRLRAKADDPTAALTARQVTAIRLHAKLGVREIAALLHLSEKGAESQRYRLIRKLGLTDRDELTRLAIREGLISP